MYYSFNIRAQSTFPVYVCNELKNYNVFFVEGLRNTELLKILNRFYWCKIIIIGEQSWPVHFLWVGVSWFKSFFFLICHVHGDTFSLYDMINAACLSQFLPFYFFCKTRMLCCFLCSLSLNTENIGREQTRWFFQSILKCSLFLKENYLRNCFF